MKLQNYPEEFENLVSIVANQRGIPECIFLFAETAIPVCRKPAFLKPGTAAN